MEQDEIANVINVGFLGFAAEMPEPDCLPYLNLASEEIELGHQWKRLSNTGIWDVIQPF